MDGRNDEANNRYGLRNREQSNRNDVLSILMNKGQTTKKRTKRKKMKLTALTRGAVLTRQTTKILKICWTC